MPLRKKILRGKSPVAASKQFPRLPTLKTYSGEHLARVAMPIGGIGTGTISLNGRGGLQDFECVNRPAKGFTPDHTFFALRVARKGAEPIVRLLEGPMPDYLFQGAMGSAAPQHNWPRFATATFDAAYPFATVHLSDQQIPLRVRLEAFNPLTPPIVDDSAWPVASIRFVLENRSREPMKVSIAASMQNFIGADGSSVSPAFGGYPTYVHCFKQNRNSYQESDRVRGIRMHSLGLDAAADTWGTLALATTARSGISYRTSWAELSWGDKLLDFHDDFRLDGKLADREIGQQQAPIGSLCVSVTLPAGGSAAIPFLLAWHFPNRQTWSPKEGGNNRVGNHYTTRFTDAWEVAEQFVQRAGELEAATRQFVDTFLGADLPEAVKEAALFNLSTLRSQTCFRTEDGHFFGWEGCHPHEGSCLGSCTHVWNYEAALPQLFGELARDQRRIEFAHATSDRGLMSFRVNLPIDRAQEVTKAAADGQMGCIVRLFREWRTSGDDGFLRELYPHMKRALAFAWIPGGWDADRDGMMEGCQHNTMDVEYYGPNPQMQSLYLAALRAAAEMATAIGDHAFAAECAELFASGSAKTDQQLFNGDYYEQKIIPPGDSFIDPALSAGMGSKNLADPDLQIGSGCLIDQLVGQYLAHQADLGYVLDKRHIRKTLRSVHRFNYLPSLRSHFNHLRSFAMDDEPATIMASYPRGRRPRRPFPYYNEVMTGFEYCAAVGMIQEGLIDQGLELIAAVRSRYAGNRRNPFDEAECGHHYARALAIWSAIPALQGVDYDGRSAHLRLTPRTVPSTVFFATGDAFGSAKMTRTKTTLNLHAGILRLSKLTLLSKTHEIGQTLNAPCTLRIVF